MQEQWIKPIEMVGYRNWNYRLSDLH